MGPSRIRLYQIGVLVGLVLLLEALCLAGIIDKITMPPPHRIAIDFVKLMLSGQLYPEIGKSLLNVFIAWVTAFAVGIATGAYGVVTCRKTMVRPNAAMTMAAGRPR